MKNYLIIFLLLGLSACGGSSAQNSDATGESSEEVNPSSFIESNGNVVMETESSDLEGDWNFGSLLPGYTGSGYYEFDGNNICSGPARDSILFKFRIQQAGTYELRLKGAKVAHCVAWQNPQDHTGDTTTSSCNHDHGTCSSLSLPLVAGNGSLSCQDPTTECLRQDISNDAFVSILDGSDVYVGFNNQPGNTLGDGIKLYGGQVNNWAWTGQRALDVSGSKWDARWDLAPGDYTLVLEGRSKSFKIDRIVLFDTARSSLNEASSLDETR